MTMRRGLSASCVSEAFKNGLLSNSNGPSSLHNSSDLIKPRKEKSRYEEDFLEIEKLGRGGYGAVYKVQNKLDGLFYALKKIQFKNTSSQLLEKVLREVKTLALLNHPNIVRYHSAWKEEEEPLTIYPDLNPSSDDHVPSLSNAHDDPSEWSDSPDYSFSSDSMEQFNLKVEEDLKKPTRAVPSPPMRLRRRSSNGSMVNVTTLYIVMQLYSTTLSQWLETRTEVDARMNLYIFREICKGLQYIHSRGVIHRDLKPGNIFLSRMEDSSPRNNGGTLAVCLGDFGLAIHNGTPPSPAHSPFFTTPSAVNSPLLTSSISSDMSVSSLSSSFPSTGLSESPMSIVSSNPLSRSFEAKKHTSAVGTLTYSSPEQRYKGIYNEKTDIYSLGIIFFELYYSCGTKMEKARVLGELRNRILPSDFLKRYPTESAFILRMMSPNPDDRPSVDEILRHELLADEFATVSRKDIVDMELTLHQQRELIQQQRAYIQALEDKLARLQLQGLTQSEIAAS